MHKSKKLLSAIFLILAFSGCQLAPSSQKDGRISPQAKSNEDEVIAQNRILDLSGKGLEKLPSDVFSNTDILELKISGNKLTGALPGEIRFLKNLKILNANDNQMTGIPAEIGQLANLEVLNYANNHITGLPLEIGNLKKLKVLNLSGNNFSEYDLGLIMKQLPELQVTR